MNYKFAIIGYPLSHSLSNVMQKTALKSCGFEGTYDIIETKSEDLVTVIKKLKVNGYNGFNVTIPHKVALSLFLEQFDEYANLSGAVNTVKIMEDKSLSGYNTDVYGFLHSLPNQNLAGKKVAIIGTGGVCRAICTAFDKLNVAQIDLYSRNIVNSHDIATSLRNKFKNIEINLAQCELLQSLKDYKVIVNATPVGMKGFSQGTSPLTDSQVKTVQDDSLIYDCIYNPTKTELILQAEKFGKQNMGGLDMLALQGARAFEIWTDTKPNIEAMKIEVLKNLI